MKDTLPIRLSAVALAFTVAVLYSACASTPTPRTPEACVAPSDGFWGVTAYPEDVDPEQAVYCACAITCEGLGPMIKAIDMSECVAPPKGCQSRVVFCGPAPESV